VKEKRGGFFGRIDVDLLVSSMKGATIMKSIQEENIEYDKFVIGLAHKVQKIQQDFNKLSDENKIRFENDVTRAITAKGIVGCFRVLQSMEIRRGGMSYKFTTK